MALYAQTGNTFSAARGIGQIADAQSAALSSGRQMLQALSGAAQTVQKVAEVEFEKEMKVQAEKATIQGVIDGQINVSPDQLEADLRDDNTNFYNKAYNEAQRTQVATNVRRAVQEKSLVLAEQYKNDPDGYKAATEGLAEELIKEYGIENKESQSLFYKELAGEVSRYAPQIMRNQYVQSREIELAAQYESLQTDSNHALSSLRVTGNYDRFQQDAEALNARLDAMVQKGDISASEGLKMKQGFIQEGQAQLGWSRVGPQVEAGNAAGAEASAKAWRDEQFKRGILTPDQIDSEFNRFMSDINALKSRIKANSTTQSTIAAGIPLDYKNKNHVKYVNGELAGVFGDNPDFSDPAVRTAATALSIERGIVPTKFESYIRASQFSQDPDVVMAGVTSLQTVISNNPHLKDQFSESDISFADSVLGFTNAGMPAQDAVDNSRVAQQMEFKSLQQANINKMGDKEDYNNNVTKFSDKYVNNQLNRWFEFGEKISPDTNAQIRVDYERIFKHNLGKTANVDGARAATERELNNKYGITYINGKRELTAYPVEQTVLGITADKVTSDNPVTKQWQQDMPELLKYEAQVQGKSVDEIKKNTKFTLLPTPLTRQGVSIYQVFKTDEKTGISSPVVMTDSEGNRKSRYWKFDGSKYVEDEQVRQDQELKDTKAKHEENIKAQEELKSQRAESQREAMKRPMGYNSQILYKGY